MITIVQKELSQALQYEYFDIKKLERNSYIPFDLYIKKENGFVIIINKGTLLSDNIYAKLLKQKSIYISSQNRSVKNLTCNNLEHYVQLNLELDQKLLDFLCRVQRRSYPHLIEDSYHEETKECLNNLVKTIVYIIQEKKDFIKDVVQYFSNEYALDIHSLHVALYAVNLGNLLGLRTEQLVLLGLAGLLHDIGIKTIHEDIMKKDSSLLPSELNEIQQHPEKSVSITKHNHINNPYIINAIMHHHERYDGSGYPAGLVERDIGQYASILGICDVFDALTSNRPYRNKFTYYEALKFMLKDESMKKKFNSNYLKIFLKSLI